MIYTVKFTTDKYFSGIPVSQVRESIIEICNNNLSDDDMKKLLFHLTKDEFEDTTTRKIPHIVFSKPKQYSFCLKAFGEEDLELLLKIRKLVKNNSFIKVKKGNATFNIKDIKLYTHRSMPEKSNKIITYKTVSPIILFKGNRRKIFDAIYNKYKHDTKLMDAEFQNSINKMLIAYMKNLSSTTNKKRSYEIYNKIDIEWTNFKIFFGTDRGIRTPMIVGEFKTSWQLPHLLGNRIGAGFGHIMEVLPNKNYDREFIKAQAAKKQREKTSYKEIFKNGSGLSTLYALTNTLSKHNYFEEETK